MRFNRNSGKKKADIHASGSASSKSEAPHRDLDYADQTFESSKYEIDRECIRSVCEPHKGQWRKLEGVRHG